MSGGSLDYAYIKVCDIADNVESSARHATHRAFAAHLRKVYKALHDLEWMLSNDTAEGSELAAIMAVITPADVLHEATLRAREANVELCVALAAAGKRP